MIKKIKLLDVNISLVNKQTIILQILDLLKTKKQIQIVTPNPEQIILASHNLQFKQILNLADIAIPDGEGVVWGIRKQEFKIQNSELKEEINKMERVTGVDLMFKLCQLAAEKKWTVGLLGGFGQTAKQTAINLTQRLPELKIVVLPEFIYGKDEKQIIEQIKQSEIDILLVAMGAPKQEIFISQNLLKVKNVKIAMGVGGAFDFYSDRIKRAPEFIQKIKMEWFWRLILEPWRWKRQLALIKFLRLVCFPKVDSN